MLYRAVDVEIAKFQMAADKAQYTSYFMSVVALFRMTCPAGLGGR